MLCLAMLCYIILSKDASATSRHRAKTRLYNPRESETADSCVDFRHPISFSIFQGSGCREAWEQAWEEAGGGWRMLEVVGEAGGRWRMLEEAGRNRYLKEARFPAKNRLLAWGR